MRFFLLVLGGLGCSSKWTIEDVDGDGVTSFDGDCWDSSTDPVPPAGALNHGVTAADIYPGAIDLPYDGIDANCDGANDFDADQDGFAAEMYAGIATIGVAGSELFLAGDCWDLSEGLEEYGLSGADIYPEAVDLPYDGIDADCGGDDDFDADGDGFVPDEYIGLPTQGVGTSTLPGGDCWDLASDEFANPSAEWLPEEVNPAAQEVWYDGTDSDCRGDDDCDQDGDGFGVAENYCVDVADTERIDCNDANALVFPNDSQEIYWNGTDDNCDLTDGDGDQDGDGFWAVDYPFTEQEVDVSVAYPAQLDDCWDTVVSDPADIPSEYTSINGFSQLAAADVYPGADDRVYDGVNQDCGSSVGEFDNDGDMQDSMDYPNRDGVVGSDCIDSIDEPDYIDVGIPPEEIYFGAPVDPWYDGVDQNCDGANDFDQDGDGQNSSAHTTSGLDCDDQDDEIYFGDVDEVVNDGVDQNCDGQELCYLDEDGDTYGNSSGLTALSPSMSCLEAGVADNTSDCDDAQSDLYPNAPELCDGQINTCGGTLPLNEVDNDGDGYVECSIVSSGWLGLAAVIGGDDCDDSDPLLSPDTEWYEDGDSDSYGNASISVLSCLPPAGYVRDDQDCDDQEPSVYPSAVELCDGQINNCAQSALAEYEIDDDGDGYVECVVDSNGWDGSTIAGGEDCDDGDSSIYPSATEIVADEIDQNCDGIERCYLDDDGDSFGAAEGDSTTSSCLSNGVSSNNDDCDDTDASIYLDAPEVFGDGIDQDCDGVDLVGLDVSQLLEGDLVITEFIKKGGNLSEREWFEVYNNTASVVDLADLFVSDYAGESFTVAQQTLIDPYDYAILANQGDPLLNGGLTVDYDYDDSFILSNGGDAIILSYGSVTIDSVIYNDSGNFQDANFVSIAFDQTQSNADNSDVSYWCHSTSVYATIGSIDLYGTPGSANDVCDADADLDGFPSSTDCDDNDINTHPGAAYNESSSLCMTDTDGDGYGASTVLSGVTSGTDCDDGNSSIHPLAQEYWSGTDHNCDGMEAMGYTSCVGQNYSFGGYNKYYLFCSEYLNWNLANNQCIAGGYDGLASISSAAENSVVDGLTNQNVWIGFNDMSQENNFVWTDGSSVTYTNWDTYGSYIQPDDYYGEDCTEMYSNGLWNDDGCEDYQPFVCSLQ